MSRRAPEAGYDFPAKQAYREAVWRTFKRHCPVLPCNAHALLMPSSECLEVDVARQHGFLTDQLHAVDDRPGVAAWITRRCPGINTYRDRVAVACEQIAAKGIRLTVANFDFTACVGDGLNRELARIGASGVLADNALVGVTVLRGREQPTTTDRMRFLELCDRLVSQSWPSWVTNSISHRDIGRLCEAAAALCWPGNVDLQLFENRQIQLYDWMPLAGGSYRSVAGSQTMLWAVLRTWSHAEVLRTSRQVDAGRRRGILSKRARKAIASSPPYDMLPRLLATQLRSYLEGADEAEGRSIAAVWAKSKRDKRLCRNFAVMGEAGLAGLLDEILKMYPQEASAA